MANIPMYCALLQFICILAIWVRYAPNTWPHHIHLHTALDNRISRYEHVYWSAQMHVWICICIPWRGHITAYGTVSTQCGVHTHTRVTVCVQYVSMQLIV